ncbi:MAG: DNRLRE domain-containing protein [Minicystis sp.]
MNHRRHSSPFLRAGRSFIALAAPLALGCSAEPMGETPGSTENVAEAQSALSGYVTLGRGVGGTVADAQLLRRIGTPLSTDPDANANFGGLPSMKVGNQGTLPNRKQAKSLFRFDLSFIPPGSTVISALTSFMYSSTTGPTTLRAKRVTAPWVENQVTFRNWNNAQAANDEATWAISDEQGLVFLEVGPLAQTWVDGAQANNGIVLVSEGPMATFSTSESEAIVPLVDVVFTTPNYCATAVCPAGRTCRNSANSHFCTCSNGNTGANCEVPREACPCVGIFNAFAQGFIDPLFGICSYSAYSASIDASIGEEFTSAASINPVTGTGECHVVNQFIGITDRLEITAAEAEICRQQIINFAVNASVFSCSPF